MLQFWGGARFLTHKTTCRCARMPRSASSRLLQFVSPIPSGRKTRPRPTYPKWKSNDVSISSMEFSWRCTGEKQVVMLLQKNMMYPQKFDEKKSWGCKKKTTCSIGFLGFLGSTSTKLPVYGMLPAPPRVEGEMSEMWIIDMIFNFCFARKCLFSRRRNTSTIHEKWMMRSSDVSYFNSTAHEIKRPWPPVSRIRSLLEKAAKCFSAIY